LKKLFPELRQSLYYKKEEKIYINNPDVKDEKGLYQPHYTIYVISKGRYENLLTIKSLEELGIQNYKLVVEESEFSKYNEKVDASKIIVLPTTLEFNGSSVPSRNYVHFYSKSIGEQKHWVLDDNIKGFYRWNNNIRQKVKSGYVFTHIEEYVEKFSNVKMSGLNYSMFHNEITSTKPLAQKNTRIYSCILLSNDIPFLDTTPLWRGKYNEDTDLSLRILKAGYGTLLFNNYLCGKVQTGTMKGGNQEIYDDYNSSGYKRKTESLIEQHPDVVKACSKFGKYHHQVNYKPFQGNKLK
jgi:hypothetical protein